MASSAPAQITATLLNIQPPLPTPLDTVFLAGAGDLNEGVGVLTWQGTNPSQPPPFGGTFSTYCLDLLDNIQPNNTYTYNVNLNIATAPQASAFPGFVGGMGAAKAQLMGELFGEAYSNSFNSATNETAFQLSIWSILYNTSTTFQTVNNTSANFFTVSGADLTPAAIDQANFWLQNLSAANTLSDLVALEGLPVGNAPGTSGAQDQILVDSFGLTSGNTPLPPTALGAGVLFAAFSVLRLRRHMQTRAE